MRVTWSLGHAHPIWHQNPRQPRTRPKRPVMWWGEVRAVAENGRALTQSWKGKQPMTFDQVSAVLHQLTQDLNHQIIEECGAPCVNASWWAQHR